MKDVRETTLVRYLTLDWRNKRTKILTRSPNQLHPYQVAIKVVINLTIPRVTVPEVTAKVEVPSAKVVEAIAEILQEAEEQPTE